LDNIVKTNIRQCFLQEQILKRNMLKLKIVFLLTSSILLLATCKTENKPSYKINAEISDTKNGLIKLVRLDLATNEPEIVDSAMMTNGKFTFSGSVQTAYSHTIILPENQGKLHFFLENSKINISAKLGELDSAIVSGSREDSLFRPWYKYRMFEKEADLDIMLNHPDYCFSAFVAYYHFQIYQTDLDTIQMVIDGFSNKVKKSDYYHYLVDLNEKIKRTNIGNKAPEFSLPSKNGNMINLSDFKGKYVLIDFWASWCAPCRAANKELLLVYDKFKAKNFEVIAISVDEDKTAWLKAIEKDGSQWIHLSELKGWNTQTAQTYGVRAVPQNFLLDTSGVIIRKNISFTDLAAFLAAR